MQDENPKTTRYMRILDSTRKVTGCGSCPSFCGQYGHGVCDLTDRKVSDSYPNDAMNNIFHSSCPLPPDVGADGNPPVPSKIENPQPNVVAGLDPATDACIIRPDDKCYENILDCAEMGIHEFSSKMAKDLDEVRGQMQSIKNYIQHLEHQLTVAQNQNNLSLTTLRAERDEYKADAERFRLIDKMFSPAFENKRGTFKIYALNIHTRQEYGFNWIDHTSIRAALDSTNS